MFCTIVIIARAVFLRGGSSSHFGFDVPAPVWQLPQQRLSDVVNTPIVPMNSSTGMLLSTWMFLKTVSDICGFAVAAAAAAAWPFAGLAGLNLEARWIGTAVPGANVFDLVSVRSGNVAAPVANAMLVSHAIVSMVTPNTSHLEKNFMGSSSCRAL